MKNICYFSNTTGNFRNFLYNSTTIEIQNTKANWAFLDIQNICKGVKERGWSINWKLLMEYLTKKHNVSKAIVFTGYIKENENRYNILRKAGFELEFRKVFRLPDGSIDGGNVDADLAFYVMDHKNEYDKAVIFADDGDYCNMVKSLVRQDKLERIISSHTLKYTSHLLKETVPDAIISIHSIRNIVEFKKHKK